MLALPDDCPVTAKSTYLYEKMDPIYWLSPLNKTLIPQKLNSIQITTVITTIWQMRPNLKINNDVNWLLMCIKGNKVKQQKKIGELGKLFN